MIAPSWTRIARFLLVLDGTGSVRPFNGSYLEWRAELDATRASAAARVAVASPPGKAASVPAKRKKLSFAERREFESLLPDIDAHESEKSSLEAFFGKTGAAPAEIRRAHERYEEVLKLIESKTLRWEELAQREADV